MQELSLKDFVLQVGPAKAAKMLGMTHPPLIRAARDGSEIYITIFPDGTVKGKRISDFPPTKKKAAADG